MYSHTLTHTRTHTRTLVTVSRYINAIIGGLTMAALLGSARRTACSARLACYLWHLHYESEYRYATSTAGSAARLPERQKEREIGRDIENRANGNGKRKSAP